jgi:hypothetical protein
VNSHLYESDFYGWTQQQADLLKTGRLTELNVDHLSEEIESMGASERHQLQNRLRILLAHLLKWQFQPRLQGRSGLATIEERGTYSESLSAGGIAGSQGNQSGSIGFSQGTPLYPRTNF